MYGLFSGVSFIVIILVVLAILITPLWLLVMFIRRLVVHSIVSKKSTDQAMAISVSNDDTIRQVFGALAVIFSGEALMLLNHLVGDIASTLTLVLLVSISSLVIAYRLKTYLNFLGGIVGIFAWQLIQVQEWVSLTNGDNFWIFTSTLLLLLLMVALSHLHTGDPKMKRAHETYFGLGITGTFISVFILSTGFGLEMLTSGRSFQTLADSWQISLLIATLFLAIVGIDSYAYFTKRLPFWISAFPALLSVVMVMLAFIPNQQISNGYNLTPSGAGLALLFNSVLFATTIGFMVSGYALREKWRVSMGSTIFGILVVVKYFEFFYSALQKSLAFIVAGLVLILFGIYFDKGRKALLGRYTETQDSQ